METVLRKIFEIYNLKKRNNIKKFLKKHFSSLAFFYRYLRYRLLLLLVVSIAVGLLDGLGLAMFLPLLEFVANSGTQVTNEGMGNLVVCQVLIYGLNGSEF